MHWAHGSLSYLSVSPHHGNIPQEPTNGIMGLVAKALIISLLSTISQKCFYPPEHLSINIFIFSDNPRIPRLTFCSCKRQTLLGLLIVQNSQMILVMFKTNTDIPQNWWHLQCFWGPSSCHAQPRPQNPLSCAALAFEMLVVSPLEEWINTTHTLCQEEFGPQISQALTWTWSEKDASEKKHFLLSRGPEVLQKTCSVAETLYLWQQIQSTLEQT